MLFHTCNITQGGGLTGVCGKTVAGSYFIQDGRRIIAAAVLATLLPKSGNNYVLANRLARYSRERQIHEMSLHILKTMPADEAYWCTTERLQQLAIQNLYQLELAPPS